MGRRKSAKPLALIEAEHQPAADGALVLGAFRLTRTGLEVTGTPGFDEWQACGQTLFGLSNASLWAIGDWIVYGEGRGDWGEMYTQALDATQKSYQTVRDAAWIAKAFQLSRRRDNVSWSHHREVAGLPEARARPLAGRGGE